MTPERIAEIKAYCEKATTLPMVEFYDNARTDLPAAIAEIERLRSEVEIQKDQIANYQADKARLDWLQHNALAVTESTDLRAAIDTARNEQEGNHR